MGILPVKSCRGWTPGLHGPIFHTGRQSTADRPKILSGMGSALLSIDPRTKTWDTRKEFTRRSLRSGCESRILRRKRLLFIIWSPRAGTDWELPLASGIGPYYTG